jgi:uncharacterized protein with LGFP repeats
MAGSLAPCRREDRHDCRLERAALSPRETDGYFRQYAQGRVYWNNNGEYCCAVCGAIGEFYIRNGGSGGEFGFPQDDEQPVRSASRATGSFQQFEGGFIASSSHGTYRLSVDAASMEDRPGLPVAAAQSHEGFESQRFSEGVVYSSAMATLSVRSPVEECINDGYSGWFPLSREIDAGESGVSGVAGRVQLFAHASGGQAAVYSSESYGMHRVLDRVLAYYWILGGPASWLGLPVDGARGRPGEVGWVQEFEGGAIYEKYGRDPVAVSTATAELAKERLGWPVTDELTVVAGEGSGERVQYFEKGAVVLRDGRRHIQPGSSG